MSLIDDVTVGGDEVGTGTPRKPFRERIHVEAVWPDDLRDDFQRDRARIVHSAGFRRLQGKTQVMGVGEGDFHRTRLTHSLEVAQIAEGILTTLRRRRDHRRESTLRRWLPTKAALDAACLAHDLGHPPYGHGGERALQERMADHGGFEGNAQTLRILVKLERYRRHAGVNPTRRTVLGVLKYPVAYEDYDVSMHRTKPPKCYYGRTEGHVVRWAMEPFGAGDRLRFAVRDGDGKPLHRCLDASSAPTTSPTRRTTWRTSSPGAWSARRTSRPA